MLTPQKTLCCFSNFEFRIHSSHELQFREIFCWNFQNMITVFWFGFNVCFCISLKTLGKHQEMMAKCDWQPFFVVTNHLANTLRCNYSGVLWLQVVQVFLKNIKYLRKCKFGDIGKIYYWSNHKFGKLWQILYELVANASS